MIDPPEKAIFFRHAEPGSRLGRIVEAGYGRHSAGGGVQPWRIYGRYALAYLFDGTGHYSDTRGITRELVPGDLIVVRPDLGHAYGAGPDADWREYYLAFEGAVFDLWARAGLLLDAANPICHLEPVDTWLQRFAGIVSAGSDDSSPALREVGRLQVLLADILAAASDSPAGPLPAAAGDARWTARARVLLEADATSGDSVEAIARRMGLTPGGFRKRFHRLAGHSPVQYRLMRRIDRACERLSRGQASIKQVAAELGFCDEFHFSRRFKQVTGESPAQFRRRIRQDAGTAAG